MLLLREQSGHEYNLLVCIQIHGMSSKKLWVCY